MGSLQFWSIKSKVSGGCNQESVPIGDYRVANSGDLAHVCPEDGADPKKALAFMKANADGLLLEVYPITEYPLVCEILGSLVPKDTDGQLEDLESTLR